MEPEQYQTYPDRRPPVQIEPPRASNQPAVLPPALQIVYRDPNIFHVSYSFIANEDPIYIHCQYCGVDTYTRVDREHGRVSWQGCCCFAFCLLCCLPFLDKRFDDVLHTCLNCGAYVGGKEGCQQSSTHFLFSS